MLSLAKSKFTLNISQTLAQNKLFHSKTDRSITRKGWHTISWNTKSCNSKSSILSLWWTFSVLIILHKLLPPDMPSAVHVTFLICPLLSMLTSFLDGHPTILVSPKFWSFHCYLGNTFTASHGIFGGSLQEICHIASFQQLSGTLEQASIISLLLYFSMPLKLALCAPWRQVPLPSWDMVWLLPAAVLVTFVCLCCYTWKK